MLLSLKIEKKGPKKKKNLKKGSQILKDCTGTSEIRFWKFKSNLLFLFHNTALSLKKSNCHVVVAKKTFLNLFLTA